MLADRTASANCQSRTASERDQSERALPAIELFVGSHKGWAVPAIAFVGRPTPRYVQVEALGLCKISGNFEIDGKFYFVVSGPEETAVATSETSRLASCDLLTERELQIAMMVAHGKVNKQIAHHLRISEYTVATYMRRIFWKIGVSSRAAMVARRQIPFGGGAKVSGKVDREQPSEINGRQ